MENCCVASTIDSKIIILRLNKKSPPTKLDKDSKIIKRLIVGDQKALQELFDRHYTNSMEIASLYCSFHDAEELVSDVFSKLWLKRESLDTVQNFRSYLFITIKNHCLNHLRKKRVELVELENVFDATYLSASNPQHRLETKELEVKVQAAIDELPPKCRESFQLVREEGLKYKDAALRLSISENTLDGHLKKATKRIMSVIKKYSVVFIFLFF